MLVYDIPYIILSYFSYSKIYFVLLMNGLKGDIL
jgi:hypothetical protein